MASDGFVHLLVSLWECADEARREEIRTCLLTNLAHPAVARIHVFLEEGSRSWDDLLTAAKIRVVRVGDYPSFGSFIDHANRHLPGEVVAIANSDISFDESLERLRHHDFAGGVLALTRHNVQPARGWNGHVWERNYGSQDAWIFRAPLEQIGEGVRLGYFGCDGLFARRLQAAGVRVTNPSADVKAWHHHASRERVDDLFTHPKSHFPGNVDPATREQHGFRCVPIEPLGRWKLYTVFSPSHEPLYERYFLGTLADDFEIVARRMHQSCPTGQYNTPGWGESVRQKIPLILEAVEASFENGFFIFADVDIQWFGTVKPRLRRLLAEYPAIDVFFQQDALKHPRGLGNICTGFFVCKGNIRTRAFWSLVGESMRRTGWGDQITAQTIIRHGLVRGLRVGSLPSEFWGPGANESLPLRWEPGMHLDPPAELLVHHANWTVGVPNKIAQLEAVARTVRLRRFRRSLDGSTDTGAADHAALTGGARFLPQPQADGLPSAEGGVDPLFRVRLHPERLPGSLCAVVAVARTDGGDGDGASRIPRCVQGPVGDGVRTLVAAVGDGGSVRVLDDGGGTLAEAPVAGNAPRPSGSTVLSAILAALPPECDKVAWLATGFPLDDRAWGDEIPVLLERYAVARLDRADDAIPAWGFRDVEFGGGDVVASLAAGTGGASWCARRHVLEAAASVASIAPPPR